MDEKTIGIIGRAVHEVLDRYLTGELLYRIERELVHAVCWELAHAEEEGGGSDG